VTLRERKRCPELVPGEVAGRAIRLVTGDVDVQDRASEQLVT
jgi:hypothetical protein